MLVIRNFDWTAPFLGGYIQHVSRCRKPNHSGGAVKQRNVKLAVRPSSSSKNQKVQDDLRKLTPRFSERADDWLTAGDWLAAGERLKTHRPQFKSR